MWRWPSPTAGLAVVLQSELHPAAQPICRISARLRGTPGTPSSSYTAAVRKGGVKVPSSTSLGGPRTHSQSAVCARGSCAWKAARRAAGCQLSSTTASWSTLTTRWCHTSRSRARLWPQWRARNGTRPAQALRPGQGPVPTPIYTAATAASNAPSACRRKRLSTGEPYRSWRAPGGYRLAPCRQSLSAAPCQRARPALAPGPGRRGVADRVAHPTSPRQHPTWFHRHPAWPH